MATLDYRMFQRRETYANLLADDPIIGDGEICLVTDEEWFVVGNGIDTFSALPARYWTSEIESLGDNDISTTNATLSMTTPNSYPVGYRFRVSWHSGDGSNTFSFTDVSGLTLDGIAFTDWVGRGTGHLDLVKTAADTWQTFGADVWDSHGGGFAGTFQKYVNGTIKQALSTTANATVSTGSGGIFVSGTLGSDNFPVSAAAVESLNTTTDSGVVTWVVADTSTASNLTRWGSYRLADSISNASASDYNIYRTMTGSWTTGYPRRT